MKSKPFRKLTPPATASGMDCEDCCAQVAWLTIDLEAKMQTGTCACPWTIWHKYDRHKLPIRVRPDWKWKKGRRTYEPAVYKTEG